MPSIDPNALREGTVYKKSNGLYTLHTQDQIVTCELSSKLRKDLVLSTQSGRVTAVRDIQTVDPVAVGDIVRYIPPSGGSPREGGFPHEGGNGLIVEVMPRRNRLSRREAFGHREQVIVSNLDQVVPVMALAQPAPSWNLLDRYLVSAASLGLNTLVVMTKADLARNDREALAVIDEYRAIGYRVILTSIHSGEGLDELREALRGQVSALIGKSGVGKSTLLNAVQPGLGLRVKAVSALTGKGRHTTTHLEMFPLEIGGAVSDTPGTREFGLWQVDGANIAQFYPEVAALAGSCRFGLDCSHIHEPGCAVRRAVESGLIRQRRYDSMVHLGRQLEEG
jgi:ribosome biogenesis GTPase / thiamine phosphate phosphatase